MPRIQTKLARKMNESELSKNNQTLLPFWRLDIFALDHNAVFRDA